MEHRTSRRLYGPLLTESVNNALRLSLSQPPEAAQERGVKVEKRSRAKAEPTTPKRNSSTVQRATKSPRSPRVSRATVARATGRRAKDKDKDDDPKEVENCLVV